MIFQRPAVVSVFALVCELIDAEPRRGVPLGVKQEKCTVMFVIGGVIEDCVNNNIYKAPQQRESHYKGVVVVVLLKK